MLFLILACLFCILCLCWCMCPCVCVLTSVWWDSYVLLNAPLKDVICFKPEIQDGHEN